MAKKDTLEQINFYEITAELLTFRQRAVLSNYDQAFFLRIELLKYIFSHDFLKNHFIERVNLATDNLSVVEEFEMNSNEHTTAGKDIIAKKEKIKKIIQEEANYAEKVHKYLQNLYYAIVNAVGKDSDNNCISFLYFPSVCDDENKIKVEDTLTKFYKNFLPDIDIRSFGTGFGMSKFASFDSGYPGFVEFYILALLTIHPIPKTKFSAGYLMTVIISVIDSLIQYIEHFHINKQYKYYQFKNKYTFIFDLRKTKFFILALDILENIIKDPKITTSQLEQNCFSSYSTVKRALKQMAKMAGEKGEISGVKEAVNRFHLSAIDIEKIRES